MNRRGGQNNLQRWKEKFAQLMKTHKPWDNWTLDMSEKLSFSPYGWYQYGQRNLFASFDCSSCARCWKSAKSSILFHLRLDKSWDQVNQGQVKMWMFRQKCHRCMMAEYEEPVFSEKALNTILDNLALTILEKKYGGPKRPRLRCEVEAILEGPHDKRNCEACEHGMCIETRIPGPTAMPASLAWSVEWEENFMRPTSRTQSSGWEEFQRIVFFFLVVLVIAFLLFCAFCFQKK